MEDIIYIKKSEGLIPVVFSGSNKDLSFIALKVDPGKIYDEEHIRIREDLWDINTLANIKSLHVVKIFPANRRISIMVSRGIMLAGMTSRIPIVITCKRRKVVYNQDFFESHPSYNTELKARASTAGCILVPMSRQDITCKFFDVLQPEIEDFNEDTQRSMINEFVAGELEELERIHEPEIVKVVSSEVRKEKTKFVVGDWVTITHSDSNWNSSMEEQVGRTVQVTYASDNGQMIRFEGSGGWTWVFANGHFREATDEEIEQAMDLDEEQSEEVEVLEAIASVLSPTMGSTSTTATY